MANELVLESGQWKFREAVSGGDAAESAQIGVPADPGLKIPLRDQVAISTKDNPHSIQISPTYTLA